MAEGKKAKGKPTLHVRTDAELRGLINAHAKRLEASVGRPHNQSDAVRDLLRRGIAASKDAGHMSGYVNGWFAGHAAYQKQVGGALDGLRAGSKKPQD